MAKCDCYHKEFGKDVCYGTKEREECDCGGDKTKCDFYPIKRSEAICDDGVTDIFTLLQKIEKRGYELTFGPSKLFFGTVWISLRDPKTYHSIEIQIRVDQNYFKDFNSIIFETIDAMIKDMDDYREA